MADNPLRLAIAPTCDVRLTSLSATLVALNARAAAEAGMSGGGCASFVTAGVTAAADAGGPPPAPADAVAEAVGAAGDA